jgi:hypothetical protein
MYPVVQLPLRLAYVHVVEESHKGFGISFNPLLPHTYRQDNRWSVALSLIGESSAGVLEGVRSVEN